jgi:hypothetical protein
MSDGAPENGGNGENKGSEGQSEKTFTQADVDRIVQDRVSREKSKYADYDDLKAFKESSKSEQQKAIDAAKAEGAQEVTGKFTARIVNAEIKASAAALGFADPGDAIALYGDTSAVELGDDGPDAKAIKERLEVIAKEKPYLLKGDGNPKVATRPKPKSGSESTETNKPAGKSRAAAALREFSGSR